MIWSLGFAKYRVALASLLRVGALVAAFGSSVAQAKSVLGVPLPNNATEVAERRYRSPLSFEATVKWLERRLSKRGRRVRFETTIDLPDVISAHAIAPSGRARWSGINVSEYGGSVKIFIIVRP